MLPVNKVTDACIKKWLQHLSVLAAGVALLAAIIVLPALWPGMASTEDILENKKDVKTNTENIEEGEPHMTEINYMTKEEFIEFVLTRNLNITIEDFDGIDIDDFIHVQKIQKHLFDVAAEDISKINFKGSLIVYLNKKLEPYMAKEIKSVISTEEEYKSFKEEYLRKINASNELLFVDEYSIDNYNIFAGEKGHRVKIGQTQNFEKCNITKNYQGFYCVTYYGDPSVSIEIFYSRNSKYFILANMIDKAEYELIKVFCEMAE